MGWFGLGKDRTKLGKFLDKHGIHQEDLVKLSGVSRSTIYRLCKDKDYKPHVKTARKIILSLRKWDAQISSEDFW
ncbi:hypothetical protein DNHGIG_26090 [Collibacillus ludicampi]|uniref:HTH cro/C1-type domain-containing protein n=1 Tax=Collibacillus ludicampi TaxID=2771369 RepID=A0AAV4LGS7_9BACL|nr:helix-turn-helix domain-containing protein [Collibacillus ludicampi]GIM47060.1 hypothetical protein DNHGIG_26090 [Collibacillus ludicampi]